MAFIEVNHNVLREVAGEINTYCSTQDTEMRSADINIKNMLMSDWIGADALEFSRKWEGVDGNDSTAVKFRESLKSFSERINACADEYKKAQENSYNDANRLPKWIYW